MSGLPANNLRDVRLAALAYAALLAFEVVLQGVGFFAGRAAEAVVDREGWTAISTPNSALVTFVTDTFDDVDILLVLLQIAVLVYLFAAGRAPRAFGTTQVYKPWFTGVSLLIPIVCLYRPWVGLGESRATLKTIATTRRVPDTAGESGVGFDTFVFAVALFAYNCASLLLAPVADSDKVTDLASARAFTAAFRQGALVDLILGLIFLAVFAWYWLDFLDLYRKAVPHAPVAPPALGPAEGA